MDYKYDVGTHEVHRKGRDFGSLFKQYPYMMQNIKEVLNTKEMHTIHRIITKKDQLGYDKVVVKE